MTIELVELLFVGSKFLSIISFLFDENFAIGIPVVVSIKLDKKLGYAKAISLP